MKILVVDRDALNVSMTTQKLEAEGHEVTGIESKNDAVDVAAAGDFDVLLIDPAPLTSARPVVLNIRRAVKSYPYIFLMSQDLSQEEAIKSGANDLISKPVDGGALPERIENAARVRDLVARIGDDSEDFPSAGGVIAKSAFNQLFLSSLDRADRYGEKSYMMFITLDNYAEILQMSGPYAAEYAVAKLSQYLVRLRRQSDIIGQTAKYEYTLLLQRPLYETEPMEAANRFGEALLGYEDIASNGVMKVELAVRLVEIPSGALLVEHKAVFQGR